MAAAESRRVSTPRKTDRKLIWVRWFDASYQRGECTLDELNPRIELESAGLFVQEDENTLSIALDRYSDDQVWRYIEHIPKANILKLKRLSI